jgi:hypothetical protein
MERHRAFRHRDQDQGLHRRLPFRSRVLCLRKFRDVGAGVLQRHKLAAAGAAVAKAGPMRAWQFGKSADRA